jgi:two-component system NtrC family sensor kinase
MVDANQIKQVFMNMVINAAQAMPNGGILTIATGVDGADGRLFVRLHDTGCGIPEENLQKIFDPFFSTKEQQGTGLGLSVSYGIVKNHGGRIEVQSEVGNGTTFTVRLPLAQQANPATEPVM